MFDRLWPYYAAFGTSISLVSPTFAQTAEPIVPLTFGGTTLAQWIIAVAGLIAVGVAIWAVILLRTLAAANREINEETKKGVQAAERAADAARNQAEFAEGSMLRQERPYMFLEISETHYLRRPGANPPFLRCFFVNHGRTPAVLQSISLQLIDDSQASLSLPSATAVNTYEVIRPGAHTEIRVVPVDASPDGKKWEGDEATNLVLLGVAEYLDGAGFLHTDSFCLRAAYGADYFVVEGGTEYNTRTTTRPQ
ncbi:MAG: hypothetical protein OER92_07705 [Alphaproteobacteria bacterium]|nr:hypothetical protein [Alphaproteobacteria bacterium]